MWQSFVGLYVVNLRDVQPWGGAGDFRTGALMQGPACWGKMKQKTTLKVVHLRCIFFNLL